MKGIIRIGGIDFMGFSNVYWNLYVVKEMEKRAKKIVGSTGVISYCIFFKNGIRDRRRVDFILVSCPSSSLDRLKRELTGRYVCVDSSFKFNKRRQSRVKVDVDCWTEDELKNELSDFPVLINARVSSKFLEDAAEFEIRWEGEEGDCPFYKPFDHFIAGSLGESYEKNLWAGTLILQAERKWKRNGGEKVWRKRKAWKLVNGNFKEVK